MLTAARCLGQGSAVELESWQQAINSAIAKTGEFSGAEKQLEPLLVLVSQLMLFVCWCRRVVERQLCIRANLAHGLVRAPMPAV
jgi:hypothetical protein